MSSSPSRTLENMENKFKNIIMTNGSSIIVNTTYPLFDKILFQNMPVFLTKFNGVTDMKIYNNRVESFNGGSGWSLDFLTPSVMANAGFYYTGRKDLVKCAYCSKEFDNWIRGDDPLEDHKDGSPRCRFFEENKGYDVCGIYHDSAAGISSLSSIIESNMIQGIWKFSGIVKQHGTNKLRIKFADFENRLKSYKKCEVELKIDSQKLCEAGFFYSGDGLNDMVECFCCNQGLERWNPNDEPWNEHVKFSPKCSFVLLSKGENLTIKNRVLKINEEELPKSVINDEKALEDNIDVGLVKWKPSSLDNEDIDKSSSGSDLCKKGVSKFPSTIPDSMLCKICLKEKIETVFITCGHAVACIQCAVILDQCAICRQTSNMVFRAYISKDGNNEDVKKEQSDTPLNTMLCKVCHKEEMQAFALPCKHIHACIACATKTYDCLVCSEPYLCIVQVYL